MKPGLAVAAALAAACAGCEHPTPMGDGVPVAAFFSDAPPRFTLPRLSAQPHHAPCATADSVACTVPLRPGSDDFARLEQVTRRIASSGADPGGLPVFAELAWAGTDARALDRAVATARDRRATEGDDVDVLNDLAAAYIVRGVLTGDRVDFVRALDALERADTVTPAVSFNRALALERLGLVAEAERAWSAVVMLGEPGGWTMEAAARREALGPRIEETRTDPLTLLDEAAHSGTDADFTRLVATYPGRTREIAFERWLPAIASGEAGADEFHRKLELATAGLVDRTVPDILEALDTGGASGVHTADLVVRFAAGLAASRARDYSRAIAQLTDVAWNGTGPLGLWARVEMGRGRYAMFQFDEATAAFGQVLAEADESRYPAVVARARWGQGVTSAREGHLERAWAELSEARSISAEIGERWNQAFLEAMVGEMLGQMGRAEEAWPNLLAAVAELSRFPPGPQLHGAIANVAAATASEGWMGAAVTLQEADVEIAKAFGDAWAVAEAEAQLIQLRGRLGEPVADSAIETALVEANKVPDTASRRLALSIVHASAAPLLATTEPERALALLDSVVGFAATQGHVITQADALLARGRFIAAEGRPADALRDLEAALRVVEGQWEEIAGPDRSGAFGEAAQRIVDDAIALATRVETSPERALEYLERARRFAFPPGSPGMPPRWNAGETVPAGHLFVQYAVVRDSVYRWVAEGHTVTFSVLPAHADSIGAWVSRWVTGLRGGREPEGLAERLGGLLLPESVWSGGVGSVSVVPDRFLNAIPFVALREAASGRRAIEVAAVTIAPSFGAASARSRRRAGPPDASAFFVGSGENAPADDPMLGPLPGVAVEIASASAHYANPTVFGGGAVTRGAVLEQLDRHAVFHFAGHAMFDPAHPDASYLLLDGGKSAGADRLFVRNLEGPPFQRLRTVILSSCSSLGPVDARVGGLWGLARPMLARGATTVVGTLWAIDDRSAVAIVPLIHDALARGERPEDALRAAQLAAVRDPTRDVGAWAAFQLLGR